jgi:hypothetical protein
VSVLFHSERLGADLHGGKLPASPLRAGTICYTDIRPALAKAGLIPTIPELFGHGHDFPQGKWLMLGNGPLGGEEGTLPPNWKAAAEGAGNCTIADCFHTLMEAEKNAGKPLSPVDARCAIEAYEARTLAANGTAYNPETGEGDTGLEIQAVIEWLLQEGCKDASGEAHKIAYSIALEPGNVQHLWEMVFFTEKVKMGLVLCEAQMTQFDAGPQPTWDYVAGSPEIGGHDTPAVGKLGLLSWAEDVYYTPAFIEHQNDESYGILHPEQFETDGKDYEGYQEGDIEKLMTEIAAEKLGELRAAA